MASSVLFGLLLMTGGLFISRPMQQWLSAPAAVMEEALPYLRIYLPGVPALLVYNFSSAVLRAGGDTRRPLVFMTVSGVMNVLLNLLLVIGFHGGTAGAAIATVISECASAMMAPCTGTYRSGI